MTLTELCSGLKNWFVRNPDTDIIRDTFEISNGSISPSPFLQPDDYFRIVGSRKNDGVWQNNPSGLSELRDEVFDGAVWIMSLPVDVESLLSEITEWEKATADVRKSPYQSESFGGYSYSLKTGTAENGASALSWQGAFAERLKPYRRVVELV